MTQIQAKPKRRRPKSKTLRSAIVATIAEHSHFHFEMAFAESHERYVEVYAGLLIDYDDWVEEDTLGDELQLAQEGLATVAIYMAATETNPVQFEFHMQRAWSLADSASTSWKGATTTERKARFIKATVSTIKKLLKDEDFASMVRAIDRELKEAGVIHGSLLSCLPPVVSGAPLLETNAPSIDFAAVEARLAELSAGK